MPNLNSKPTIQNFQQADIFIYLLSIANRFDIDVETAFREKEEVNKKREWK